MGGSRAAPPYYKAHERGAFLPQVASDVQPGTQAKIDARPLWLCRISYEGVPHFGGVKGSSAGCDQSTSGSREIR